MDRCRNSHYIYRHCHQQNNHCERFEPRSHSISRLSMIVRVNLALNKTVVDSDWRFDNLFCSDLQSQSKLYHVSWWYFKTLVIDLIGQLSCDVIGRLSVKPWCCWLWRLEMPLVRFYRFLSVCCRFRLSTLRANVCKYRATGGHCQKLNFAHILSIYTYSK